MIIALAGCSLDTGDDRRWNCDTAAEFFDQLVTDVLATVEGEGIEPTNLAAALEVPANVELECPSDRLAEERLRVLDELEPESRAGERILGELRRLLEVP